MKNLFMAAFFSFPVISYAQDYGCATVGAYMEIALSNKLSEDLNIEISTIQENKTKVEVLGISPVSKVYAAALARIDFNKDPNINKNKDTYNKIYFSSYYENNVKSITAKYTYFNKENKKDVFIATSLMNKDECSIRFNGYITLSREF